MMSRTSPPRRIAKKRRTRAGRVVLGLVAALAAGSCVINTDLVPAAFNAGALDSASDPFRDPDELRKNIVARLVRDELVDGYFAQGSRAAAPYSVAAWLRRAATEPERFVELTKCLASEGGEPCRIPSMRCPEPMTKAAQEEIVRENLGEVTGDWIGDRLERPICRGQDEPDWPAFERALDEVRFNEGMNRAARLVAEVLTEHLVDEKAVRAGAKQAFEDAAKYVGERKWRRERGHPTTGLVVKGGAATGIYSAGAVWGVLHLIHGCMLDDARCAKGRDLRFKLLSGTSTGAMIAIAVDRFNAAQTAAQRAEELEKIAKWFTCYSLRDLFCVQSAPIVRLFADDPEAQMGVLDFDGIRRILTSCVGPAMRENRSELILNTVDFRTGRLFSLSDQAELQSDACVVQAGLASALLPVIGQPVVDLPGIHRLDPARRDETEPAYLDGGIRSELPVIPLARRGAERVLVVSSSASVLRETKRLKNALEIAARYIDVSTGGITESELSHARRHVESLRYAEMEACYDRLKADDRKLCPPDQGCDVKAVCEGLWSRGVCSLKPKPRTPVPVPAPAPAPPAAKRAENPPLSVLAEPFWKLEGIFRDEYRVEALNGYNFRPAELRRLFRAGAEAARQHCIGVARLVGILPEEGDIDPALEADVVRWCTPELPKHEALCPGAPTGELKLRRCGEPPPETLWDCGKKEEETVVCEAAP